jgi:hypothetical protein
MAVDLVTKFTVAHSPSMFQKPKSESQVKIDNLQESIKSNDLLDSPSNSKPGSNKT